MTRVRTPILALALIVMLACATSASAAQTCASAPGTSALDQYCETIPSAGGGSATGNPGTTAGRSDLPRSEIDRLERDGAVGQGLLHLAVVTTSGSGPRASGRAGARASGRAADEVPSSDPLSAVTSAVADGPTLSPALPLVLLLIAVLAGAVAWLRARTRRET